MGAFRLEANEWNGHTTLQARLCEWRPAALRGELREVGGHLLYLDCYNANPASMADALEAFAAAGLDPSFYTHRPRPLDETFPWDHISSGVRKEYLTQDYRWSLRGQTRIDCRERCFACAVNSATLVAP